MKKLLDYGFTPIANVSVVNNTFKIATNPTAGTLEHCVYAFVAGDEIIRIGSSKSPLLTRFKSWERDVTNALNNRKSPTPEWEARAWADKLGRCGMGYVYAKRGTTVKTAVGEFNCYLDEERVLIARHKPSLNRSGR